MADVFVDQPTELETVVVTAPSPPTPRERVVKAVAACAETTFEPPEICRELLAGTDAAGLTADCARGCVQRRNAIAEAANEEGERRAGEVYKRAHQPPAADLEPAFEPEPRASDATCRAALAACIAGVVEASRPGVCVIPEPVGIGQLQDCNDRCAAAASAEIRRRVAPRAPLGPMLTGDPPSP